MKTPRLGAGLRLALRHVPGWMLLVSVAGLVASGLSVVTAFALAGLVGDLLAGAPIGGSLGLALGSVFARGAAILVRDRLATATTARLAGRVRAELLDVVLRDGVSWRALGRRDAVSGLYVDAVEHLRGYVGWFLPQALVAAVVPVAVVVVLLGIDPVVALLVGGCLLAIPASRRLWNAAMSRRGDDHWERFEAYAARIEEAIRGLGTLLALGAVRRHRSRMAGAGEELRRASTAGMRTSLGFSAVMIGVVAVGTTGATVLTASAAAQGRVPVGAMLLVLFLSAEAFRPQIELGSYWHESFYGLAAAERIAAVLSRPPALADDGREILPPGPPAVELRGVDFTYPGSDRPALSDVSVFLPPGAVLAVVGASGSGKSTLGRIALRDLDPDDGAVLLGGVDARALDLAALRAATSRVDQDAALLSGTIRENVLPGGGPDDAERLEWAVRAARVDEFADRLPSGLDSDVGESGARLSGGQRQRIAFARGLATGASLGGLEEATSALDAENESLISEALARLRGQVTMVVIAHRLSTVRHADLVLVLDGGRVVEFGGPDELLAAGGWWAAMVEASRADLAGVEGR